MDLEKLDAELKRDEGERLTAYRDTLGNLTIGYGHLILDSDHIPEGSTISEARSIELYIHDRDHAIVAVSMLFGDVATYPELIQRVLVNLMFNLGPNRLAKFKNFVAAIKNHDYIVAGNELENSLAYEQEPQRFDRLIAMCDTCADDAEAVV